MGKVRVAGFGDSLDGFSAGVVQQCLKAGPVDSIHLAQSLVLLGRGKALFAGIDLAALGFSVSSHTATEHAMHILRERN